MSSSGPGLFRTALLVESAANIGSIIPMITNPESVLSYLVKGPAQITPAAKTLTQWFGGLIVLATAPLVLSYAEPSSSQPPSLVTARRRLTYLSLGASECALAVLAAGQYIMGDSGMSDNALLGTIGMMVSIVGMRAFFLFAKPEMMEGKASSRRSQ